MKKTIVFGCFLSVFLMLMIPMNATVQYQNQKNISESIDEKSISEEKKSDSLCGICDLRERIQEEYQEYHGLFLQRMKSFERKYPEYYNLILDQDYTPEETTYIPMICEFCALFMTFIWLITVAWLFLIVWMPGIPDIIHGLLEDLIMVCDPVCDGIPS